MVRCKHAGETKRNSPDASDFAMQERVRRAKSTHPLYNAEADYTGGSMTDRVKLTSMAKAAG